MDKGTASHSWVREGQEESASYAQGWPQNCSLEAPSGSDTEPSQGWESRRHTEPQLSLGKSWVSPKNRGYKTV